ncbi:MAG: hypothetical protein EOP31_20800 [Rhodococcus sp. (in: high G+C Gram-positive bacteria)]|uniref:hypothetical protein n=1 Tax=Rhodococcus sp. TaxID=1831 RepID=UPI00121CC39B|nr:hypothetical protein [Rhodococcus sp. (in: high G+C Gram-positive bacteria)]RZL23112.1 MAG: hypothetical protein EOP31_20800 [Rhodococcus sp. (in: high G+C Gram-positive bacteria)]
MKVGQRLGSAVCTTNVVVVRAADVALSCGGVPVVEKPEGAPSGEVVAGFDGGTQLGKRYTHAGSGLEVMCVSAGSGALSVDGELLELKSAKSLPASD